MSSKVDSDRELRNLIREYRIKFKSPTEKYPSRYEHTFNQIRNIRNQRFDNYCADNVILGEKPWMGQTKRRAEWLSNRASSLIYQERNEEGWRFDLENDVLHRFLVEVAW
jgi:hypothetical protein